MARPKKILEETIIGKITDVQLGPFATDQMQRYGAYVVMERAVADVRDGMKPVQRRILWAMNDLRLTPNTNFGKCAKITGKTMGEFHPHSGTAIFGALVNMVHDRYPLIEGHGNFGGPTDPPAAERYCVAGDTLIDTDQGVYQIKDLYKKSDYKVPSLEGKYEKIEKWIDSGVQETLTITTKLGYEITATPNHPILVFTPSLTFEWKQLKDIQVGDYTCIQRNGLSFPKELNLDGFIFATPGRAETKIVPKKMTPALARVLGYLVSEGHTEAKEISFSNNDLDVIDDFEKAFKECFPDTKLHKFYKKPRNNSKEYYIFEIHSRYVVKFLHFCGLLPGISVDRRVPWSILQANKESVTSFLSSYFEGDGGISSTIQANLLFAVSQSEKLLKDIQIILLKYGIIGNLRINRKSETKPLYTLCVSSSIQILSFLNQIGFRSTRKKNITIPKYDKDLSRINSYIPYVKKYIINLCKERRIKKGGVTLYQNDNGSATEIEHIKAEPFSKSYFTLRDVIISHLSTIYKISKKAGEHLERICNIPYAFTEVISIKSTGNQRVYDLTVAQTHAFTGNGILCHNTESRLTPLALTMFQDKDVAHYIPNYSGDLLEPLVLPSRAPMLLLNGSAGIGVGMSACIPPHNIKEIISALIFLIKNPDCRFSTLLHYIQGPDYNTGVLTSSDEEVKALYANGKGSLEYRCRYHYEDADDGSTFLVLTQLAPAFNLSKFLEKMKDIQDQNLINYCSDVSSSEGMKILISFNDVSALRERVLPELNTSISYQFYVVKRDESEKLSPETLLFCALRDLLQEFIDFRKIIEELRLNYEKEQKTIALSKAEAVLIGIQNLDKIYEVLQNKQFIDTETLTTELAKALDCTLDQARIILQMKVQQLAKMNENEQKAKINDILTEITEITNDLQNIPKVIIKHLQELLEFGDERGTTIREIVPELKEEELTTKWVVATGKKIFRYNEKPRKSCDHIVECTNMITAVTVDNYAYTLYVNYFTENKLDSDIIALASDVCTKLVVLDDRGLILATDLPMKKSGVQLLKGATKIIAAVGLVEGESVEIVNENGGTKRFKFEEVETTRIFVQGKKWFRKAVGLKKI